MVVCLFCPFYYIWWIYIYASHSIYFISGTADPKLKDCKVIFVIGKYWSDNHFSRRKRDISKSLQYFQHGYIVWLSYSKFSCLFFCCKGIRLTPSQPCYQLKTTDKRAKSDTLTHFCLLFALAFKKIFNKTYSIESRCVIGPKNTLFAGASVHLSARKFYRLGQWRG